MKNNLFLPHLNTQTNSNLSFSFLTVCQLINWASEKNLEYLAIADYYPYEVMDFFRDCKAKKIKPVWGVKIFGQEVNPERIETNISQSRDKGIDWLFILKIIRVTGKCYKNYLLPTHQTIVPFRWKISSLHSAKTVQLF